MKASDLCLSRLSSTGCPPLLPPPPSPLPPPPLPSWHLPSTALALATSVDLLQVPMVALVASSEGPQILAASAMMIGGAQGPKAASQTLSSLLR
jgi:hypothetical protein